MQEETDRKCIAIALTAGKLTAKVIIFAMKQYCKKHIENPRGKQSVKKLVAQNKGVTSTELNSKDKALFNAIMRKYGIDYSFKRVNGSDKYLLFFKPQDNDGMLMAVQELAKIIQKREVFITKVRQSIRSQLHKRKEKVQTQTPELPAAKALKQPALER